MAANNGPAEGRKPFTFVERVRRSGMDASLLYESVIELADEGLLTAGAVNAAAGILLEELGLPDYFFHHISKPALKDVLRAIATHMRWRNGRFELTGDVAEARFDVDGGVQARIATEETRDRMEAVLNPVMSGRRIEYYFSPQRRYYTYIVRPDTCKELAEVPPGASRFAFAANPDYEGMPPATRERYEAFLRRAEDAVVPVVEVTPSETTDETRIMFREDFCTSPLPLIRKLISDLGLTLNRAYWETYRGKCGRVVSICSLYVAGRPAKAKMDLAAARLADLLALEQSSISQLYLKGDLEFDEFLFAVNAHAFVHNFLYKGLDSDRQIWESMAGRLRDAFAKRVFDTNRSEYTREVLAAAVASRPELVKELYKVFERRFHPRYKTRPSAATVEKELDAYRRRVAVALLDDTTGRDVFLFMARLVTDTLKTNFYKMPKRSFSFRFSRDVLDPLVFPGKVFGVFYTVGFYSIGTHMRAEDVARGGLRILRVSPSTYEDALDDMPLLNYALGPVAQRLKHKDIAESGAKGVIAPHPAYAPEGLRALLDYTEGIMDLIQPCPDVVDCHGSPEMVFFGPDEGSAPYMDAVAERAKERGYRHWRTITTGKSIGVPHDEFGLTAEREVFALVPRGEQGTELQLDGKKVLLGTDTAAIYDAMGERIDSSGMTTTGVMACFRTILKEMGVREEDVRLMMTGGPDGDLGGNQIQTFKGTICMVVDGGGVLFDPEGLDRRALMEIAFARHTKPRLDSMAYPESKLGAKGFKLPRKTGAATLPGGLRVDDGALFHRNVLAEPKLRPLVEQARINAFIPCGGLKDTVNAGNVGAFLDLFQELCVIVEGANVFFDDAAREAIAEGTTIIHIKDSSANKGGVFSSSVAEVLTAFLLGDDYEKVLVQNAAARAKLVREVFDLIRGAAAAETRMLMALRANYGTPLFRLSVETSEQLFAVQDVLALRMNDILARPKAVEAALRAYVPPSLVKRLGVQKILDIFSDPELASYRNAMITKKLASMALYRYAEEWDKFTDALEGDLDKALDMIVSGTA